jgi:hypothetical protein
LESAALGKKTRLSEADPLLQLLPGHLRANPHRFSRLRKGDNIYHSEASQQTKTRNSFTVAMCLEGERRFASITSFIEAGKELFAVVSMYKTSTFSFPNTIHNSLTHQILMGYLHKDICHHIFKVDGKEADKQLVPVHALGKLCVLVDTHTIAFLSCPPNVLEHG